MPARTSRLRATVVPAWFERFIEIGVRAHRDALETIRVARRDRERSPSVAKRRAIARPRQGLAQLRWDTGVVSVRIGKQLHYLLELGLEGSLGALELLGALGWCELGKAPMRDAVRLHRDASPHELTQVIPVAQPLVR